MNCSIAAKGLVGTILAGGVMRGPDGTGVLRIDYCSKSVVAALLKCSR